MKLILCAIFVKSWCGIVDRRIMILANGSLDWLIMDAAPSLSHIKGIRGRDGLIQTIMNFDKL